MHTLSSDSTNCYKGDKAKEMSRKERRKHTFEHSLNREGDLQITQKERNKNVPGCSGRICVCSRQQCAFKSLSHSPPPGSQSLTYHDLLYVHPTSENYISKEPILFLRIQTISLPVFSSFIYFGVWAPHHLPVLCPSQGAPWVVREQRSALPGEGDLVADQNTNNWEFVWYVQKLLHGATMDQVTKTGGNQESWDEADQKGESRGSTWVRTRHPPKCKRCLWRQAGLE